MHGTAKCDRIINFRLTRHHVILKPAMSRPLALPPPLPPPPPPPPPPPKREKPKPKLSAGQQLMAANEKLFAEKLASLKKGKQKAKSNNLLTQHRYHDRAVCVCLSVCDYVCVCICARVCVCVCV